MAELNRPKIGVAVIIHDGQGGIIVGERKGSHGAGMFIPILQDHLLRQHASAIYTPNTYSDSRYAIGTLQCPGGHLENGESFETTAARESLEETGLEIGDIRFLTATNDVFGGVDGGKHYVTVFVTARIVGEEKVPKVSQSRSLSARFAILSKSGFVDAILRLGCASVVQDTTQHRGYWDGWCIC